jgi:hypothetical protein
MFSQLNSPPRLYPCLRFTGSLAVAAQDSGPSGSLVLSRKNFAFSTSYRFIPAHINRHTTHPMREDVKQKHLSTLSVRPRSVLASRPLLRGEDFGFNAWIVTEYDRDTDRSCWSPLSGFMQRSDTIVAKLRKPTVGLSANHHPMGGSRPMAFLGYPRGHRIDSETGC